MSQLSQLGYNFFETAKIDQGRLAREDYHLNRIKKTIAFMGLDEIIDGKPINEWAKSTLRTILLTEQYQAVRIDFNWDGKQFLTQFTPRMIKDSANLPMILDFNPQAVRHSDDPFWQYKFCGWQRNLHFLRTLPSGVDDIIFINQNRQICETTRANIYLKDGNHLLTPPLESGVLDGTYRRWLLDQKAVIIEGNELILKESPLLVEMISPHSQLFLSNALIGLVPAKILG